MPTSGFNAFARFSALTATLPPPASEGPVQPLSGAVYDVDGLRGVVEWSSELPSLVGEDSTDPDRGRPGWWLERIHPEDRPRAAALWAGEPRTGGPALGEGAFVDVEYRVRHATGDYRWVWEHARVIRDGARVVRRVGCVLSVHARKQVELDLARERERLALAQEAGRVGLWDWDARSNVTYWSDAMFQMYGVPNASANIVPDGVWKSRIEPDDAQRLEAEIAAFLPSDALEYRSEFRLRGADGGRRWIETVARVERGEGGRPVRMYGINLDVTARRQAEQQAREALLAMRHAKEELEDVVAKRTSELRSTYDKLRLAERMATVGTLAAGLGHDIGNLLLPLRVRVESLARMVGSGEGRKEIEDIRQAMGYLGRLTRGLRMFTADGLASGGGHGAAALTDLNAWIADVEPFFRVVLPAGAALRCTAAPGVGSALIAPHQLTQAVYNLVQNAGEALRGQGRGRVDVHAAREGEHIVVSVQDDGPGMSSEVAERCLDAFYSSKPQHTHGGLGLALVRSIVSSAGGRVELRTSPGQGATFRLLVGAAPAAQGTASARACVCVEDPRTASLITEMLRRMHVSVEAGVHHEPAAHDLLVASGQTGGQQVRAFLEAGPRRVAVLVGTNEGPRDGLLVVPPTGGMAALQETLSKALERLHA